MKCVIYSKCVLLVCLWGVFLLKAVCFSGNDGDDFLVLGLRNGRVLHKFNLGSGVATIVSDRLNQEINIHTVVFGRSKRTGWLKVISQITIIFRLQCTLAKCFKSLENDNSSKIVDLNLEVRTL